MLDAKQKLKLFIQDRPWETEPDNAEWVDPTTKYLCRIWRHPTHLTLNGYVGVPPSHMCYEMGYDEVNVTAHGGLTYASKGEEVMWFGFDTNHAGDFSPGVFLMLIGTDGNLPIDMLGDTYRTWEYVEQEVTDLALQLHREDKRLWRVDDE